MIRLFDTATGAVRPLELREPGKVSMYVCGPTVYGPAHLGHGRFSLVFDILRRYLEWTGLDVTYVSNITDIDDKIIAKGLEEGIAPAQVAKTWEKKWKQAMRAINVKAPTHDPHATDYVEQMVALIGELIEGGAAYVAADGVYFSPAVVDDYGLLARQSLDSLQAGARVEVDDTKRTPVDFALWKLAKPGEPSWPSPWGDGRPGWHTECVVMSLDLLGEGFDIHGGGQDLAFPHHENERAQAVADGKRFAGHWVHNGFVEVSGEKMAKSLGNFTNLLDLTRKSDPRAFRLLVLRAHYRSPVEITDTSIADAAKALERLDTFARRTADLDAAPDADLLEQFRTAMDNDLDTPRVMDAVFTAVRRANQALDMDDTDTAGPLAAAVRELCGAVGLVLAGARAVVPDAVRAVVAEMDEARAAKDFARSDALRDDLVAQGWIVEATASGTTVRRA